MSSTGFRPVTEQVVDDHVQTGKMFTAHDITLEVRNRGHKAGHNDVRDAVHDYFQRGGMGVAYTRTTISVPSGGTPFLYHRTADDPATYANIRGQGMVPNPSVNTISVPPPSSITSTDDEGDGDEEDGPPNSLSTVSVGLFKKKSKKHSAVNESRTTGRVVDARKTLLIPSLAVKSLGFKVGDKAYVSAVGNTVEVTNHPTNYPVCKRYTVNRNYHIRITHSTFKRAGLVGKAYDVCGDGNGSKLVVKLHK